MIAATQSERHRTKGRVIDDGTAQSLQFAVRTQGTPETEAIITWHAIVGAETVQAQCSKARHVWHPRTHISDWIAVTERKLTAMQLQYLNAGKGRLGGGRDDRQVWEVARIDLQVGQRRGKRSWNGEEGLD